MQEVATKVLYRLPDHRPPRSADRDKEVYDLKQQNQNLSFGELAMAYNRSHSGKRITDKDAERAYKQHESRIIDRANEILSVVNRHREASDMSEDDIAADLSSPEDLVDI